MPRTRSNSCPTSRRGETRNRQFGAKPQRTRNSLEALLRREIEAAAGDLVEVRHGIVQVEFRFTVTEAAAASLKTRLGESGQGRIGWKKATS